MRSDVNGKEEEEEQTNQKSMHGWMDVGGRKGRKRKVHSLSIVYLKKRRETHRGGYGSSRP
jgi:hypothetical protein